MELLLMVDAAKGAVRGADHRGDAALRLRPLGQEGRLPDLAGRPARRGPAGHRRGQPGADHDAARAAGARLLLGAGRPPQRAGGARRALPRPGPHQLRRGLARPRQRQDRHPLRPAARPAGRGGQQAAAGRRPGRHRRDRRRRRGQARDRARRRDRHRRLDRRAARQARRPRLHAAPRSPARTGCSSARPSTGSATTRSSPRWSPPTPSRRPTHWPELKVRSVAELFAEAISRVHAGESVSSLFDGVDPTLGPPQPKLPFDD